MLKHSKCSFVRQSLEYLGYIISAAGVPTDPAKIQALTDWPIPTHLNQLRGFLGLSGYCRKFIKHYGVISKPLTDLLKKNIVFLCTPQHQQCFDTLKQALISASILAPLDFTKGFTMETDASAIGIGAILMQDNHPVAYLSKALGPKHKPYPLMKKSAWQ